MVRAQSRVRFADARSTMALSTAQLWTLACCITRSLLWGLRATAAERRVWENTASAIPDATLRVHALDSLRSNRGHIDGAALFGILPQHRCRPLLRALIAYEVILEFLDDLSERSSSSDDAYQLHRALAEAVDIAMPISDYYRHRACDGDGDYLRDLVQSCREGCASLPWYEAVRPALRYHATVTATVQCLSHNTRRGERDQALRAWAHNEYHYDGELRWWEMTAAASSSLAIHVLLALAAKPEHGDTAAVLAVFTPWVCAVSTLLDSYVDEAEDANSGNYSYVSNYASSEVARQRIGWLTATAMRRARALPDGDRYAIILASMVAMYLSKNSALAPAHRRATYALLSSAGPLAMVLWPILRLWRTANRLHGI
jgi:tetraprenyl-beta-curcumene synthase